MIICNSPNRHSRAPTLKKVKDLKVLDSKAAQNLSILLGGSLKHMSYEHIRLCILKCDTAVLTGNVLDLLIQVRDTFYMLNQIIASEEI